MFKCVNKSSNRSSRVKWGVEVSIWTIRPPYASLSIVSSSQTKGYYLYSEQFCQTVAMITFDLPPLPLLAVLSMIMLYLIRLWLDTYRGRRWLHLTRQRQPLSSMAAIAAAAASVCVHVINRSTIISMTLPLFGRNNASTRLILVDPILMLRFALEASCPKQHLFTYIIINISSNKGACPSGYNGLPCCPFLPRW